jgi:SAM-dependent methyltransferase
MTRISRNHSNRKHHNWLIYKLNDKFLVKYSHFFKGHIYDLGCGEKPYEAFILESAEKYIGVDWSNTPHLLKAEIIADLNKPLPIESEVADVVISLSTLEHLCEPQVMLGESFRILKPGGVILLQVPWQWWIHEAPYDYYRYSPYGLKYLFQKTGFENIDVEPIAGFFTTMVLKTNYFTLNLLKVWKPLRALLKGIFIPFWFLGQVLAPILDKLDRNWQLEAQGYWVVAQKNKK